MADIFGNTQFGIPTVRKSQPASPAPGPPDEGVDPFGTSNIPPDEPDQPAPVTVDPVTPPVITLPVDGIGTDTDTDVVAVTSTPTSTPTGVTVPTGPDGETEFGRPVFTGDAEQAAEIERERQVAREILLRRHLRGEEVAPTSRNQLREALGITNAEAAHLGLSDFSDAPDLREDRAAFAAAVATINRERQRPPRASHSAVPCRPRTLRAIPGRQGRIRRGPPGARFPRGAGTYRAAR